jgi:hypothetical protein
VVVVTPSKLSPTTNVQTSTLKTPETKKVNKKIKVPSSLACFGCKSKKAKKEAAALKEQPEASATIKNQNTKIVETKEIDSSLFKGLDRPSSSVPITLDIPSSLLIDVQKIEQNKKSSGDTPSKIKEKTPPTVEKVIIEKTETITKQEKPTSLNNLDSFQQQTATTTKDVIYNKSQCHESDSPKSQKIFQFDSALPEIHNATIIAPEIDLDFTHHKMDIIQTLHVMQSVKTTEIITVSSQKENEIEIKSTDNQPHQPELDVDKSGLDVVIETIPQKVEIESEEKEEQQVIVPQKEDAEQQQKPVRKSSDIVVLPDPDEIKKTITVPSSKKNDDDNKENKPISPLETNKPKSKSAGFGNLSCFSCKNKKSKKNKKTIDSKKPVLTDSTKESAPINDSPSQHQNLPQIVVPPATWSIGLDRLDGEPILNKEDEYGALEVVSKPSTLEDAVVSSSSTDKPDEDDTQKAEPGQVEIISDPKQPKYTSGQPLDTIEGGWVKIDREPDHAVVPIVSDSERQLTQKAISPQETSTSTKTSLATDNKETKNKKKKKSNFIDLPLVKILIPSGKKSKAPKKEEQLVNKGVEKETTRHGKVPEKQVDSSLFLNLDAKAGEEIKKKQEEDDESEAKPMQLPQIDINVNDKEERTEINDEASHQEEPEKQVEEEQEEVVNENEQAKDGLDNFTETIELKPEQTNDNDDHGGIDIEAVKKDIVEKEKLNAKLAELNDDINQKLVTVPQNVEIDVNRMNVEYEPVEVDYSQPIVHHVDQKVPIDIKQITGKLLKLICYQFFIS